MQTTQRLKLISLDFGMVTGRFANVPFSLVVSQRNERCTCIYPVGSRTC